MKHIFRAAAMATATALSGNPAAAQGLDQDAHLRAIYERLYVLGSEVCVTDPCPVSQIKIGFLGQSFDAVTVHLPDRTVYYILIEDETGTGRGGLYSCEPLNYVEISPPISCKQLA